MWCILKPAREMTCCLAQHILTNPGKPVIFTSMHIKPWHNYSLFTLMSVTIIRHGGVIVLAHYLLVIFFALNSEERFVLREVFSEVDTIA